MRAEHTRSMLCGHINSDISPEDLMTKDGKWERVVLSEKEFRDNCNYYYERFVDSMIEHDGQDTGGLYSEVAHLRIIHSAPIACRITGPEPQRIDYNFDLLSINIFFFPHNIILYAIEIESKNVDLNDYTLVASWLRNVSQYGNFDAFEYKNAIQPLLDICNNGKGSEDYCELTHTGNKMKIFQVVICKSLTPQTDDNDCNQASFDNLLYELGSLTKIGSASNTADKFCPSQKYFEHIMHKQTLSVFRNWKMLALHDTVTVLASELQDYEIATWINSTFRFIYIHALYQKTLLFLKNQEFHSPIIKSNVIHKLAVDMKENEHYYAFSNISYNFLPQLIYKQIDIGLEVDFEREELHEHIQKDDVYQRAKASRRFSQLLYTITFLTLFSTLSDGTIFLASLNGYAEDTCIYRCSAKVIAAIVTAALLIVALINCKKNK